ncbi:MAG: NUDIX hydrolase, partial [Phycicoccus sp.]
EWGAPGGGREPGESVRDNAVREVHEETGLEVDGAALRPVGYERFRAVSGTGPWTAGQDLLQMYEGRVPGIRPPLVTTHDDTSDRRWVTRSEFARLCGGAFWWPLADAVLNRPGG